MGIISKIEPKVPQMPTRKRVAAYARVSMETERLQHSISAQISYYSNLIQSNPAWEYVGVYADCGISGTSTKDRTEFNRLIEDCEKGLIDIVLTKSISRFARNTVDLLKTVRHLKELGIEVRFEKENINSLSGDGEVMLTLLASFAQEEVISLSNNTKWGIRKRMEQGEPRKKCLYGYVVKNGQYTIKEDEAIVVQRIFQMFLDGDSCYAIAKKLNREGIKSYTGKDYYPKIIANMIRQEKYTGCALCQKFYIRDALTHKKMKNKGELPMYFIEDTHPAIISKEIFHAAQEEFASRYSVKVVNGIAQRASYLSQKGWAGMRPKYKRTSQYEKRKKVPSEYFESGKYSLRKYDFSHFIVCENCYGHLRACPRHYAVGSTELAWIDFKHASRTPDAPRPVVLYDSALKEQIAACLGWDAFDANKMLDVLKIISINIDIITLHFKNGETKSFQYIQPKQKHRNRRNNE